LATSWVLERGDMDDVAIARAIHVLAVVVWIGGVAMVTTILLPIARRGDAALAWFEAAEKRFAGQARVATLLAGASGLFMLDRQDLWYRFAMAEFWWMHAMVGVWLLFTFVLFVAEPLFLDRWFRRRTVADPQAALALIQRFHWVMLALSLLTILGAAAGSHGLLLFG
jgi:uncharacterized membrane protein